MSDAIRVGLIGYGYASKTFHAPLIGGTPGMALTRVSSSEAGKVHADWPGVRVVSAAKDLLNDPDIDLVVIATPMIPTFRWRKRRWKRANMWWWINPLP